MNVSRSRAFVLLSGAACLLWPATALRAQVPGGRPGMELSRFRLGLQRVRAEAMVAISQQLAQWQDDWTNDDSKALAKQYADSARVQLVPGGQIIIGRRAIEQTYAGLLPHVGSMGLQIQDFDAGENLAFVLGDYRYYDSEGRTQRGAFVLSLRKVGHDRWQIHSQLFAPTDQAAAGGFSDQTGAPDEDAGGPGGR